jgi:cystathionine gamma-synthase
VRVQFDLEHADGNYRARATGSAATAAASRSRVPMIVLPAATGRGASALHVIPGGNIAQMSYATGRHAFRSSRINPQSTIRNPQLYSLSMRLETLAVHAGAAVDPVTRALTPSIHLSTTFERAEDGTFPGGFIYSRSGNPTRLALEQCLKELEGGAAAAAFASGSAATVAIFQALHPGDHVVASEDAYYGTPVLLRDHFSRWGLDVTFVDMREPEAIQRAVTPKTRLIWIETPSNPRLHVTDIAACVRIASGCGAKTVVDNTWATPVLQRPFAFGVDLVMHSTTKYLGGHSDVLGGVVIARENDAFFARVREIQGGGGAVPSPFDCWLVLRGIRSLPYRMRGHAEGARRLAEFLAGQPSIEQVYFPGLASDPGHAVAARQMTDFGGMLAIGVRGGRAEAFGLASRLKLVTRATSLGGPETLIEHRASIEGARSKAPENLLRISVGLEHPDDLIDDFRQAL